MYPAPLYMDIQASVYHRNLARSGSAGGGGGSIQYYPRANLYSRSISLRNGYRNGSTNNHHPQTRGDRLVLVRSTSAKTEEESMIPVDVLFNEAGLFLGCPVHNFVAESDECVYSQFARCHKCYDLIPTSTKLIVFDTQLPVKKAFHALLESGLRAAPLWSSGTGEFVGMLTITDFIHILRRYYKSGVVGIKELEEHKIATWREVLAKDQMLKPFLTMDPRESLYKAVRVLCEGKVHRLPIMDKASGNILYILTQKKILRFLYAYIRDLPTPAFLRRTPRELGIGAWDRIPTATEESELLEVLSYFLDAHVSAVPVVAANGRVVDIYAKADVFDLAADKSYNNLSITVKEALKHRSDPSEGLRTCRESESLADVLRIMFEEETQRVVVIDDQQRLLGLVTLSDLMAYLVLRQQSDTPSDSLE